MGRKPYNKEQKVLAEARRLQGMKDYGKRYRGIQRGIMLYKRLEKRRIASKLNQLYERVIKESCNN